MAKRKRLTPAQDSYLDAPQVFEARSTALPRGPIAQVSGDAATASALEDIAGEMRRARETGRLIQSVPLDAIQQDYLVRDRVVSQDAEMDALMQSIAARGQQQPIEVVPLGEGRFGLISGWRRLNALYRLREAAPEGEGEQFADVLAMLRHPDTAAEAYLSMVEENEIRVGLSYYERARIAAKAVEQGVHDSEKTALLALFGTASRAKRSKIRSFLPIYHHLDDVLRFAGAIPERLGLRLSKMLGEDALFAQRLHKALARTAPATAEAEAGVIEDVMAQFIKRSAASATVSANKPDPAPASAATATMPHSGQITITGPGVDAALLVRLREWLASQA